jgi:hypothetical protein
MSPYFRKNTLDLVGDWWLDWCSSCDDGFWSQNQQMILFVAVLGYCLWLFRCTWRVVLVWWIKNFTQFSWSIFFKTFISCPKSLSSRNNFLLRLHFDVVYASRPRCACCIWSSVCRLLETYGTLLSYFHNNGRASAIAWSRFLRWSSFDWMLRCWCPQSKQTKTIRTQRVCQT